MKIQITSPSTILKILEPIYDLTKHNSRSSVTIKEIISFTKITRSNVLKTINTSITLGILEAVGNDYTITDIGKNIFEAKPEIHPNIFGKIILDFKPFIYFCEKLASENDLDTSIEKTIEVFPLEGAKNEILGTFKSIGKFCGILGKDYSLVKTIQEKTESMTTKIVKFSSDIENEAGARIFLLQRIQSDVYKFLPSDSIDNLTKSVIKSHIDPDDAVSNSTQGLEIFLKKVADTKGETYNPGHGVGQLAQSLPRTILDTKHLHICLAIGAIRNMVDHGNIPEWKISSDIGILSLSLTLTVINSIYEFAFKGNFVF